MPMYRGPRFAFDAVVLSLTTTTPHPTSRLFTHRLNACSLVDIARRHHDQYAPYQMSRSQEMMLQKRLKHRYARTASLYWQPGH